MNLGIENNLQSKASVSKKSLIVLMSISLAVYLAVTILSTIFYADVYSSRGEDFNGIGVAVGLVLLLGYGSIGNLISVGVSIAGVCVSKKKQKLGLNKLWMIFFSIMIVLPIITEVLFVVLFSSIT